VRPYLEKKPNSKKGWQSGSSSNPREFNPQYQRGKKKKRNTISYTLGWVEYIEFNKC
jgi:hypothetical protein